MSIRVIVLTGAANGDHHPGLALGYHW